MTLEVHAPTVSQMSNLLDDALLDLHERDMPLAGKWPVREGDAKGK